MTINDVDWMLRCECDAIRLSQATLNQIAATISASKGMAEPLRYFHGHDENGRRYTKPETLAGKKIILDEDRAFGSVWLMQDGEVLAGLSFPEAQP
jgi:hypothetical protein